MRKLVSPWKDHLINFYEYKKLCGYKYDSTEYVLVMFDQYYANLKIEDMEFDSIITAVSSGKADFGISGITVTEERLKNIDFSIPYTTSSQVVIVRNNDVKASGSSFADKRFH